MKLVRTVFEIELDDKKFELRKPKFKETQQYRESLVKEGADGSIVMRELKEVFRLSVVVDVYAELEMDHIEQLMASVTGSKKN